MARLTATQAARNFSDVLNRVAAGEEIEVTRNGLVIAAISRPPVALMSPERFDALMASLPEPDERFAADLREIRASVGPPRDPWQS
jgi:prevent-host-death family protein